MRSSPVRPFVVAAALLLSITAGGTAVASDGGPAGDGPPVDESLDRSTPGPQRALSGVLQPGSVVQAQTGPPTPASEARPDRADGSDGPPPRPGRPARDPGPDPDRDLDRDLVRVPDVSPELGRPLPDPDHNYAPPPGDPDRLTLFRDTTVPVTTGLEAAYPEPSTDQLGPDIFATANKHAEFSRDNGDTWQGLDVFNLFGPNFCCDQVTVTDPVYRRQHWVVQYTPAVLDQPGGGSLVLANSAVGDFVNWRPYTITPSVFGYSDEENLDYNDLVIGERYVYLTTRVIRFTNPELDYDVLAAGLLRISRADLAAGRPAHYDVIARTDITEEMRVPQGITDIAYAAATSLQSGKGRLLRLLVWPEGSKWVTTVDRLVPAFRYGKQGEIDCSSRDGAVNNWCSSTVSSGGLFAARGRGRLWFAWVAQPFGDERPFPYVRITTVRESDLSVDRSRDLYSRTVAYAYPAIAPDKLGHIGLVAAYGGGAGERDYFPGAMIAVFDDVTPVSPTIDYFLPGKGNACVEVPDTDKGRWGDYLTIRGSHDRPGVWLATAFARKDDTEVSCDDVVPMTIKNTVFGRERDRPAHERAVTGG